MQIKEAMLIISGPQKPDIPFKGKRSKGFMVTFEKVEGRLLKGDYFPDKHAKEALIPTEEAAWELAKKFANATSGDEYVYIYVVNQDWKPVEGYAKKMIRDREWRLAHLQKAF